MKQTKLFPKVAADLFYEQAKWSLWFFSFLIAAHLVGMIITTRINSSVERFFVFSSDSVVIFMLVCGVIAAYAFLSFYVQQGISRKDLYIGTVLGAAALALSVTFFPLAVNGVEYLISRAFALPIKDNTATLFVPATGWVSDSIIFYLNVLTYYVIGWVIGVGYYRFGWLIGFVFIAIGLVAMSLNSLFWTDSSVIPWIPQISANLSAAIAMAGSIGMIVVLLVFVRLLTKRIPIKM